MASLPLGRADIQINSGNLLLNCFNPNHGWLWTDGKSVFLLSCQDDGVIEDVSTVSRKLGDYGKVIQLSWSTALDSQSPSFLAVQEPHSLTIWEVTGRSPNQQFTLKKKLEPKKQINGIIWHPLLPIVCILSSSDTSVLSLNPDWLVRLSSSHHTTGCWTTDGKTLILAENRSLKIYLWDDILNDKQTWKERHMTFDRFQGKLRSLVGLSSKTIIATTDLPLVEVIHQSNQDLFEPFILNSNTSTSRSLITELSEDSYDSVSMATKEGTLSGGKVESSTAGCSMDLKERLKKEIMQCGKGPVDLTAMMTVFSETRKKRKMQETTDSCKCEDPEQVVQNGTKWLEDSMNGLNRIPIKEMSPPVSDSIVGASSLFMHDTFVKKEELSGTKRGWNPVAGESSDSFTAIPVFKKIEQPDVDETANVHLIDLSLEEPAVLDSCKIHGLITPDLVTLQHQSSNLLVGSRNSEVIQRFEVKNGAVRKLPKQLSLNDQERPVGIQCGPCRDVVSILVSKPVTLSLQNVFPSSSGSNQVELCLRQFILDQ